MTAAISAVVLSTGGGVVVVAETSAWELEAGLLESAAAAPITAPPETMAVSSRDRILIGTPFLVH